MQLRFLPMLACAAVLGMPSAASAAQFVATLHAPNHRPRAGTKTWRITVTAHTRSGRALHARATYKFLYNHHVVSTQYPNPGHTKGGTRPYAFTGSYRDTILWPKRAIGIPLVFRVVVAVRGRGSVALDWKVRVRR